MWVQKRSVNPPWWQRLQCQLICTRLGLINIAGNKTNYLFLRTIVPHFYTQVYGLSLHLHLPDWNNENQFLTVMIWLLKDCCVGEQTKKVTRKFHYTSCLEHYPQCAKPGTLSKAELLVFRCFRNELERVYIIPQLRTVIIPWSITKCIQLKRFRAAKTNLQSSIRLQRLR